MRCTSLQVEDPIIGENGIGSIPVGNSRVISTSSILPPENLSHKAVCISLHIVLDIV